MLIRANSGCGLSTDRLKVNPVGLGPLELFIVGHFRRFVDYLLQSDLITSLASFGTVVSFVQLLYCDDFRRFQWQFLEWLNCIFAKLAEVLGVLRVGGIALPLLLERCHVVRVLKR